MDEYEALKLKNQLCFPLYAASKEVVNRYRPYLSEIGLTYTQYITMMVIWEHQTIDAKDLGQQLLLDSGTLTPVLKSLESKGFVSRRRFEKDERHLIVELTDAGLALRDQAKEIPAKIASCVDLEPGEAAELYRLLYKIMNAL